MKVLVVATHVWPTAARISVALAQIGFEVASVSPSRSLVRTVTCVAARYTYAPHRPLASIAAAIRTWKPIFLVCADDGAVRHLHDLHATASTQPSADAKSLMQLIESSLGEPQSFTAAAQKSIFMTIASNIGARCPRTWVIPENLNELIVPSFSYPVLVKADGTFGGQGVRLARNEDEARKSVFELAKPKTIFNLRTNRGCNRISVQEEVVGRPANRAVFCSRGSVLAGISVEAIETQHALGPSSIVQLIENAEMTAIAQAVVETLQLSGFIGFDFILDSKNNAWLIEMNPRVTPISHLCLADGTSLPSTMFASLTGQTCAPQSPIVYSNTIVLFPAGLWQSHRTPRVSSAYTLAYHDVPWGEPELIKACINYRSSSALRRHASSLLGSHFRKALRLIH